MSKRAPRGVIRNAGNTHDSRTARRHRRSVSTLTVSVDLVSAMADDRVVRRRLLDLLGRGTLTRRALSEAISVTDALDPEHARATLRDVQQEALGAATLYGPVMQTLTGASAANPACMVNIPYVHPLAALSWFAQHCAAFFFLSQAQEVGELK